MLTIFYVGWAVWALALAVIWLTSLSTTRNLRIAIVNVIAICFNAVLLWLMGWWSQPP